MVPRAIKAAALGAERGVNNMPLTPKGKEILASMKSEYGSKKGVSVFYASKNKGVIKGVDLSRRKVK